MTIKELYEEAVKQGKEDWDIGVYDYYGDRTDAREIDWEYWSEYEEVFLS